MILIMNVSLFALFTYVSIDIAICIFRDTSWSSRRWSEALGGPPWATRVDAIWHPWYQSKSAAPKCLANDYMLVILIFLVCDEVFEY
jgi:hypothetical protein